MVFTAYTGYHKPAFRVAVAHNLNRRSRKKEFVVFRETCSRNRNISRFGSKSPETPNDLF